MVSRSPSPILLAKGSQTALGLHTLVEDRGGTNRPVVFKQLVIVSHWPEARRIEVTYRAQTSAKS
jgi:hypothetical protein